jgi:glyoxylase-like metal-dependent hydrolase (beta-lactamase superfamily II)
MATNALQVGDVTITALVDLEIDRFPWGLDQIFPAATAEDLAPFHQRYPEVFNGPNGWRVDVSAYLLQSQGHTILVDTGGGPASTAFSNWVGGDGQLPAQLQAVGVDPNDIEAVLITHLHWDHVGWTVRPGKDDPQLTFPRARYLVHQADWDTFQRADVQAAAPFPFVDELVTPIQTLGALDLFTGDHTVTSAITMLHTPGHTPGSVSILVASAGEKALIWGDAIVHPALVTEPAWEFGFDMDKAEAARTREALLSRVEAEGMIAVSCHMPAPGYGRIVRLKGRRWWTPFDA